MKKKNKKKLRVFWKTPDSLVYLQFTSRYIRDREVIINKTPRFELYTVLLCNVFVNVESVHLLFVEMLNKNTKAKSQKYTKY